MFSPEAENLIAHLSRQLAPADRGAFRRAAESALGTPQCWGPGLIHRTVVGVWRSYFHPPTDEHITAWEWEQRQARKHLAAPKDTGWWLSHAQAHRRKRPHPNGHGTHDRRSFYRSSELAHAQIAAVEIADPYGPPSDATATPEPGLRRDGTQAAGELEWRAPEAPRLVVVRSLRGDQIARMEARHRAPCRSPGGAEPANRVLLTAAERGSGGSHCHRSLPVLRETRWRIRQRVFVCIRAPSCWRTEFVLKSSAALPRKWAVELLGCLSPGAFPRERCAAQAQAAAPNDRAR